MMGRTIRNKKKVAWAFGLVMAMLGLTALAADDALVGDLTHGAQLYRMHCAVCHGFDGSGKGKVTTGLKGTPADHRNGALMNARDDKMLFNVIQTGCKGTGCDGSMPAFDRSLSKLDIWDLIAYLRSLHMPLVTFFTDVNQYLVKEYTIGQVGGSEFKEGQIERLEKALKKVSPAELTNTVFTLYRSDGHLPGPELVPQQPRRLAKLRKDEKIGYVLFMTVKGPRGRTIPVGLGLDNDYTITRLVTTFSDPGLSEEYNRRFANYQGMGKRGDKPEFSGSRDKIGKFFDQAVTRLYLLAVEAANAYESEERERSWADGTF